MRCEVGDWVEIVSSTKRPVILKVIEIDADLGDGWFTGSDGYTRRMKDVLERRPGGGA